MEPTPFSSSTTSSSPSVPPYQQTVAYVDWVMGSEGKPVVRIFGSTPCGQKALLHLHGCFPYLYCDIPFGVPEAEFLLDIKLKIDAFLRGDKIKGRARVFRTSIDEGKTPIYGFAEARNVCKIELFEPTDVRKVCEHLAKESFRVYNANVGYLLQVMVDLDIAGMDDITCKKYCFRGPLPDPEPGDDPLMFKWTTALDLPSECVAIADRLESSYLQWYDSAPRPARTSNCELELDVDVGDVTSNKPDVPFGSLASKRIKFVKSLAVWWMAEEARRKTEGLSTEMEQQEIEEEENHITTGDSFVEDPYNFRGVIDEIARKVAESVANSASSGAPTPVEFRRTRTPYEIGRVRSFFTPTSLDSPLSQETMDVIHMLESWQPTEQQNEDRHESSAFDGSADDSEVAGFTQSSPSQMTDEELLLGRKLASARSSNKTVRFAETDHTIMFDDRDRLQVDKDGSEEDDEEIDYDDEGDASGQVWEEIMASQREFVERMDDDLDGGAFDDNDTDEFVPPSTPDSVNEPTQLLAPPSPLSDTADNVKGGLMPPSPMTEIDEDSMELSVHEQSNVSSSEDEVDEDISKKYEHIAIPPERMIPANESSASMDVVTGESKQIHGGFQEDGADEDETKNNLATGSNVHAIPTQTTPLSQGRVPDDVVEGDRFSFTPYDSSGSTPVMTEQNKSMRHPLALPSNGTVFVAPVRMAPPPGSDNPRLERVVGRALFYSDPRDVPKRTADEFRNIHLALPKSLLETVPPAFRDEDTHFPSGGLKRFKSQSPSTRWFEPARAAPMPDGQCSFNPRKVKDITQRESKVTNDEMKKESAVVLATTTTATGSGAFSKQELNLKEDRGGPQQSRNGTQQSGDPIKSSTPPSALKFSPMRQISQLSQTSSLSHATPGNPNTGTLKKMSLRTALEKNPASNHLTLFGFEILARSRATAAGREGKGKPFALCPDPDHDAVLAIFYAVRDDWRDEQSGKGRGATDEFGVLYVAEEGNLTWTRSLDKEMKQRTMVTEYKNEVDLFEGFISLVEMVDPDVLLGWEVQKESLGYLLHRAKVLGIPNFPRRLSRVPFGQQDRRHENDSFGDVEHSGFWLAGRHIFNLWRVCREELKLYTYTIQNVLFQLTGDKIPKYSFGVLCGWWDSALTRVLVCKHFEKRVQSLFRICDHLDIIGRNCELARLFGMDLFSVMTRGSQFRVEAVLLRVCRGLNYLMLSPTPKQVAAQPAMEATPLIFEPESAFYSSPVLVMDFRSLYPSVIIANNMCFSTCLGRLKQNNPDKDEPDPFLPGLGCDPGYSPPLPLLTKRDDFGFVSPNGICFVSKKKREGLLPRMLKEILDARVMIKKSVEGESDEAKKRVADARQFGLKMIANVTYGYTAASFSGRMPCAEIADAIVQTGRACLEKAIKIVLDKNAPWAPAECVYGDTDSLFIHLPGRDLEEARQIGKVISAAVSQSLPSPMKLQFEKVFFPCVLEVKKRYVGWKFPATRPSNGPDKGTLDAKGIETIRRDGCPAVVKTMELVLKELFTSQDLSKVKAALKRQIEKMFAGTVTLSDFILSGKVKLGSYAKDRKNKGNYPPAAVVADKMLRRDPRAKPVYKERVCYVVACGPPGARLIDLVIDPHELIVKNLRVNVAHYVFKLVLPALDRLLSCASVDVKSWFSLDKTKNLWGGWRRRLNTAAANSAMIQRFFEAVPCVLCAKPSLPAQTGGQWSGLCSECGADIQRARCTADVVSLLAELKAKKALEVCAGCVRSQGKSSLFCGSKLMLVNGGEMCLNLDCEDFFVRRRAMDRVVYDIDTLNRVE